MTTLVFKLGELNVLSIEATSLFGSQFYYFWKIPSFPKVIGPFNSINCAVVNYEQYKANLEKPSGSIILVDFKSKKRILEN